VWPQLVSEGLSNAFTIRIVILRKRDCKLLSLLLSVNLASRLLYVRRVRVFEGHL
jgi:hypothetical protein